MYLIVISLSQIIPLKGINFMSETLTAIISVLVPTIGIQIGIMFFIFRRMDRMEERLAQRMDRADEDRIQIRSELAAVQTSIARLEGAVEVLRGLVERLVTAPR